MFLPSRLSYHSPAQVRAQEQIGSQAGIASGNQAQQQEATWEEI
jgi:hypothetical protein